MTAILDFVTNPGLLVIMVIGFMAMMSWVEIANRRWTRDQIHTLDHKSRKLLYDVSLNIQKRIDELHRENVKILEILIKLHPELADLKAEMEKVP